MFYAKTFAKNVLQHFWMCFSVKHFKAVRTANDTTG